MSTLLSTLESSPQFAEFTGADLAAIEAATRPADFADGEDLVTEGERADGLYFVLEGRVLITRRSRDGRRRAIGDVGKGEMLGLVGLVEHTRRSASATADGPVRAAHLPRAAFTMLFESDAPISLKFQKVIARQLARDARELNEAMEAVLRERPDEDADDEPTA